ncbi:MAG TPA: hypothetical protein VFV32_10870, partial [Acidimicrobiales bacterium]|nr:hypothetical protein [Acidimicrobiales bacterium]
GSNGYARRADLDRPDVGTAFAKGSLHGFDVELPAPGDGTFDACVYAINVGPGSHALLGCQKITTTV